MLEKESAICVLHSDHLKVAPYEIYRISTDCKSPEACVLLNSTTLLTSFHR